MSDLEETVLHMLQEEYLTVNEVAKALKLGWHDIFDICSKNGISNPTIR